MDQQLDQYQKSLEKAWKRLKSSLLKGIPAKYQVAMAVILIFVVTANVPNLYHQVRFLISVFQNGFLEEFRFDGMGVIAYGLFQCTIPVLALIGAFKMLFSKTQGWVFVTAFLLVGILWHLAQVIGALISQDVLVNAPLVNIIDDVFSERIGLTVFWMMVYVICFGFLMSKPIKNFYKVTRKQVGWSIGIVGAGILIEVMVFLIALSYE